MSDSSNIRTQAFGRREYPRVSCKTKPFFERIKCKTKRLGTIIYRGFKHSSYLQTIIIILLIILIINCYLIYNGHFNEEGIKTDFKTALSDGLYFTTTQFTTIGYGDMGPKTKVGKLISSGIHVSILFIALKLAEEFGILNNSQKLMERTINENKSNSYIQLDVPEEKTNIDDDEIKEIINKPVMISPVTISPLNYY